MSAHSRFGSLLRRSSYSLIHPHTHSHHIGEIAPSQEEKHIERRHRTDNCPWPEAPTAKQHAAVEAVAQAVLDARRQFPEATLADLYDPLAMPPVLVKAHAALYEKLTAPLLPAGRKTRCRKRSS